jgi:hypothetical protein
VTEYWKDPLLLTAVSWVNFTTFIGIVNLPLMDREISVWLGFGLEQASPLRIDSGANVAQILCQQSSPEETIASVFWDRPSLPISFTHQEAADSKVLQARVIQGS